MPSALTKQINSIFDAAASLNYPLPIYDNTALR